MSSINDSPERTAPHRPRSSGLDRLDHRVSTSSTTGTGAGPTSETVASPAARRSWRPRGPLSRGLILTITELALIAVLYVLYKLGRMLISGQEETALRHAETVYRFQETLRLPSEAAIQAAVHSEALFRFLNTYYTGVHFPLMILFLVWGFLRRPLAQYRWARNLLILQTGAALVIHIIFPLAPPRMFPRWGFVDTMTRYGPSPYDGASADMANQFAAMPSLHVGWAVLIAYVVARTGPRWLAGAAAAHALLTTFIVVVTANHWWLDAVVGVLLLVAAAALLRWMGRTPFGPGTAVPAPAAESSGAG